MTFSPVVPPVSRTFISQRLQLHYLDWGNPDAPTLILIHGGQDHAHNWDWIADTLRHDWHVIAPDLRGHGESSWSPDGDYGYAAYVYDLAQLIHQCADGPVAIVGHSLGGVIAARYAGTYPERVRRLVSAEGISMQPHVATADEVPPINERLRGWIEGKRSFASRQPRRFDSLEEACARMSEANQRLSIEQSSHLTLHGTKRNEDGTYSWRFDDYTRRTVLIDMTRQEEKTLYAQITCPVLLLHGKESWLANPEVDGRADFFANRTVISFNGAGHWMHHDRTADVLSAIQAFLAD